MESTNPLPPDDFLLLATPSAYDETAWRNVVDDFLSPLADEISDWLDRFPCEKAAEQDVVAWIEDLTYILHAIVTGVGSQDATERWERAKVDLVINVHGEFVAQFEAEARFLFDRADETLREFPQRDHDSRWGSLQVLAHVDAERFLRYLRNCCLTLQALVAGDTPTVGPKGKKAERQVKSKRGRKLETDPKEDKRVFEAWQTGRYRKYEDLARELRMTKDQVHNAIDRHRKRAKKPRKRAGK